MYLYPQQGLINLTNYCVPDCPTVNFQMVNNPILGRCEFLGYYCMHGNYIEGCKRPYLENSMYLYLINEYSHLCTSKQDHDRYRFHVWLTSAG